MKKASVLLLFALLTAAVTAPCQETQARKDASYLIEGVEKIYVVDESRCSSPQNPGDAGKVYLIEGKEKIEKIRKALEGMRDLSDDGGCLCGGPDKHYYCILPNDQRRYWGLDCDKFLNGLTVTADLNALINPKYETFIGTHTGYALVADVPIKMEEQTIKKLARSGGYELFYEEGARQYFIDHSKKDIPFSDRRRPLYPIKILVSTSNSLEESKKVSAILPFLQNVRCVCDELITKEDEKLLEKISKLSPTRDSYVIDNIKPVYTPPPNYPGVALALGQSGVVIVQMLIDKNGSVIQVKILSSPNSNFIGIIDDLLKWKFTPPTDKNGKKVAAYITKKFNFTLDDKETKSP